MCPISFPWRNIKSLNALQRPFRPFHTNMNIVFVWKEHTANGFYTNSFLLLQNKSLIARNSTLVLPFLK